MTVAASPVRPMTVQVLEQELAALSLEEIRQRVRIVLPDRTLSELFDNYVEQVHRMATQDPMADRDWLRSDANGVFFLSRAGDRLDLVVTSDTPTAPATAPVSPQVQEGESTVVVLDQSGSMKGMNDAVFAGAREVVENLPDTAAVRLITFNTDVHVGARMSRDEALDSLDTRVTEGLTALRDAIVKAVECEKAEPMSVTTFVVLTDGADNQSRATVENVRDAIEEANRRNWRFLFLGANQDAITTAATFGIPQERALTFGTQNAPQAFRAVSENVQAYRSLGTDHFTGLQRSESVADV